MDDEIRNSTPNDKVTGEILQVMAGDRVPDPGGEYWKSFESRLRNKTLSRRFREILVSAAAILIVVLGLGLLYAQWRMVDGGEHALENRIARLAGDLPADALIEVEETVFPSGIYDSFTEESYTDILPAGDYADLYSDYSYADIYGDIEDMSDEQVSIMVRSLKKELTGNGNLKS